MPVEPCFLFRAKSLRNMDITGRSKHFDVLNRTHCLNHCSKGLVPGNQCEWEYRMHSSSLSSKRNWKSTGRKKYPHTLYNGSIITLRNLVLLRGVRSRPLMKHSSVKQEILESSTSILWSLISLQSANITSCVMKKGLVKLLEALKYLSLAAIM